MPLPSPLLERLGHASGGAVHHRPAALFRGCRGRLGLLVGLDDPGLDPKLPESQPIVRLELDRRAGEHHQPLAASVLEQISGQLAGQRVLVVGEALTVARGKVHAVLVGDVCPGDRERFVLLHLAGQFPGDLHWAHLGPEGTAEGAFDQASDLFLQVSEHTHTTPRRGTVMLRNAGLRFVRAGPLPPSGSC